MQYQADRFVFSRVHPVDHLSDEYSFVGSSVVFTGHESQNDSF